MSNIFSRSWLREFRHPSDETLLLYLDGEIGPARHRQITVHLQNCWTCRNRRDKIEHAIGAMVDCLSSQEDREAPPRAWRTFEARLHALAVEPQGPGTWRPFAVHAGPLKYAFVSALLAVLVFWGYLSSSRTVSAMELLSRAEAAETRRIQEVGSRPAFQKLRLRRTTSSTRAEHIATVQYRAGAGSPGLGPVEGDPVWQDVERILRTNGMERPLSALAYERWRSSVPRSRESVKRTRLEDGSDAFALETESALPRRPDTILESTLVVRAEDWRPVEHNLRVQAANDVVRYDLTEVAFDVRPADVLRPEVRAERRKLQAVFPTPPLLEPAPPVLPPLMASMVDLEAVEIQTRYALHHLRACLGEPIEVARDSSGRVVVRGLVETAERKEELLAALQQTPWTIIDIRTPEEATLRPPAGRPSAGLAEGAGSQSSILPLQAQLQAYFKPRVNSWDVADEISAFTNRAISLAQSFGADAWALRRLAEAYPPQRAVLLHPAFQRLLAEMLQDHTASLRNEASECRTLLEPFLASLAASGTPAPGAAAPASRDELSALFESARDAERLALTLFTATSQKQALPHDAAAQLLNDLRDVEAHSDVFARELNRDSFLTKTAKDTGGKRR
jgi:hypothetical protein